MTLGPPLHEQVAALTWLQSLRLAPDLVTPGAKPEATLEAEAEALFGPLPLMGMTLLEIGAGNGGFSLAALRRGAVSAVVTDHLAWSLPGAEAGMATMLALEATGAPAQAMVLDPRALTPEFGRFDLVLGTAFFEQLFNPILALRGMSSVTGQVLLLETAQAALDEARPMLTATTRPMPYGALVSGWAPNPALMGPLLRDLGFVRVLHRAHPIEGAARGLYAAFKPDAAAGLAAGFGAPWRELAMPA
ncbi:class I SAM-dependent methyltransferase [Roseococcus sp. SDR]|uniref:class I SAM-dependent methyltransferase n=1 Tax=Roseococcus sp. SDR TaxID=2835532 RepID=UPI001BCC6A7E|nr:class I SAM-dependent methyltransferase [Roseococcus sp. SDR]MBS7791617.1 hypothetical protein [Roseococcus sp. SDR]MBV1846931.1 class I SAM-dependent methyltransferase [Roseococcus sp. SDR]